MPAGTLFSFRSSYSPPPPRFFLLFLDLWDQTDPLLKAFFLGNRLPNSLWFPLSGYFSTYSPAPTFPLSGPGRNDAAPMNPLVRLRYTLKSGFGWRHSSSTLSPFLYRTDLAGIPVWIFFFFFLQERLLGKSESFFQAGSDLYSLFLSLPFFMAPGYSRDAVSWDRGLYRQKCQYCLIRIDGRIFPLFGLF